jgi:hypothetical protein
MQCDHLSIKSKSIHIFHKYKRIKNEKNYFLLALTYSLRFYFSVNILFFLELNFQL